MSEGSRWAAREYTNGNCQLPILEIEHSGELRSRVMAQSDAYLLGRSEAEQARLVKQVAELAGEAEWLLDRLQIRPGARALDLGCGPQGVLELLAQRVGPQGSVVGLEKSADFVAAARKFVADRRLPNV